MKTWNDFEKAYSNIKNASTIIEVLSWDQEVLMPENAAEQRANQMAYLQTHIHEMRTESHYIEGMQNVLQVSDLNLSQKNTLKRIIKDSVRAKKVPSQLVSEIAQMAVRAQQSWKEAKTKSDYSIFKVDLQKTYELQKLYAECVKESGQTNYEALISEFEPDFPIEKIRTIFNGVKKELVPLSQTIVEKYKTHTKNHFDLSMPLDEQKVLNSQIAERIGFDLTRGRIDESAHPFCSGSGSDVRLTTRFKENDWTNSLYSVLHEAGHGMYEQGVGVKLKQNPAATVPSLGIHESQSRFWENCIGRSKAFSRFMSKFLASQYPKHKITAEDYYSHVNNPQFSYIRVDSDEMTYNLHILIRYELEEALFSGDVNFTDLPHAWDAKVKEYLHLPRVSDAKGVLQDVHWSCGTFGYFPTYTIGNIISAELNTVLRSKFNLDDLIENGKFLEIRQWLNDNIHSVGLQKTTLQTIEDITGRSLTVDSFIQYLKNKF